MKLSAVAALVRKYAREEGVPGELLGDETGMRIEDGSDSVTFTFKNGARYGVICLHGKLLRSLQTFKAAARYELRALAQKMREEASS